MLAVLVHEAQFVSFGPATPVRIHQLAQAHLNFLEKT